MKYANTSSKSVFIKFSFMPSRTSTLTLTKAPMAHKTNSKEQFKNKFFKFAVTFHAKIVRSTLPTSLDGALLSLLLTKTVFPSFETNLLLLKSYRLYIPSIGSSDFDY